MIREQDIADNQAELITDVQTLLWVLHDEHSMDIHCALKNKDSDHAHIACFVVPREESGDATV